MTEPVRKIAVVQGASSAEAQAVFRSLVDRWRQSARLAGVVARADRCLVAGRRWRACQGGLCDVVA